MTAFRCTCLTSSPPSGSKKNLGWESRGPSCSTVVEVPKIFILPGRSLLFVVPWTYFVPDLVIKPERVPMMLARYAYVCCDAHIAWRGGNGRAVRIQCAPLPSPWSVPRRQ